MSLNVQQSHQESLKMNSDFWPPRGLPPNPSSNNFQPMMDQTNDYHHQRNQQQQAGFHNNNNNNNNASDGVDMKDHLTADQENQNNFNQSQSGFQINQQQPAPVASPGAESSSPESKFNTDKFVNEIQVSCVSQKFSRFWSRKNFWRQHIWSKLYCYKVSLKKVRSFSRKIIVLSRPGNIVNESICRSH